MNLLKRAIVMAAGAALAGGLTAGPARAATIFPSDMVPVTATTHVVAQVPGNGGIWATEWVLRTATVSGGSPVPSADCGPGATSCYAYTATVWDRGWFRTYRFALTPNQFRPGRHIRSIVTGQVNGFARFATFYATTAPSALNVPGFFAGPFGAAATWPTRFFPGTTTFKGLTIGPWSVTYGAWTVCGPQRWVYASWNGLGDLPFDGNITGCFFFRHRWWS